MVQQSDLDSLASQIAALSAAEAAQTTALQTATGLVQQELDLLRQANPTLDLTGVQSAVQGLSDVVAASTAAVAVATTESTEVPIPPPAGP